MRIIIEIDGAGNVSTVTSHPGMSSDAPGPINAGPPHEISATPADAPRLAGRDVQLVPGPPAALIAEIEAARAAADVRPSRPGRR